MRPSLIALLVLTAALFAPAPDPAAPLGLSLVRPASAQECPAVLNHTVRTLLDGKPTALCQYAGKVVLVVNTASQCGFTYQYEKLEALYKRYRDRGLVVIGFPANDFGQQEPGGNKQIADFCQANFGVSFPMFEKLEQPIRQAVPFAGLIAASGQAPGWNFTKYLVDRNGKVSAFATRVEPDSPELARAVDAALRAK